MGELGSMWTPHHRRVIEWKQTHHQWVGECVDKPPPTWDQTHHLQHIEWESSMASPETRTPFCFFPFVFLRCSLWLKALKGRGGSSQSWITESKICGQTPSIYVLRPRPTTAPTHMCKLVDTFYNGQYVTQAWNFMLTQQNGFGTVCWSNKVITNERRM
jgi:hypothetical protein